jgi:hypothetical protein
LHKCKKLLSTITMSTMIGIDTIVKETLKQLGTSKKF